MSDKCYNIFTFFGNKDVQDQVNTWYEQLEEAHKPSENLPYSSTSLFNVFLLGEDHDPLAWFGQKWVYPDFGKEIDLNSNELGFVSAWGSPDGLQDLLTKKLAALDKNVVILNTYNSSEYQEAFRYTTIGSDGNIRSEGTYLHPLDSEDDFNYQLYYEHQIDCIEDLIDEVPKIKKNLAKELKRVEKLFDSTFGN